MAERIARLEKIVEKLVNALGDVFIPREVFGELEPKMWIRQQEYFDYDEQVKLEDVTTVAGPFHEFKERPVKFMWLYADGANMRVSLNKAVSSQSFVIPNGSLIWVRRKTRRVYTVTTLGEGDLYIWGFY